MFPTRLMHFYFRVLVSLPLSLSLPVSVCLSLHPLQSARGGVSPQAKHMLLSIALIQMQRGGIIARVAVASQRLCPSLAPVSQAHAISIISLSLSPSLSVSNSDLLSNQALTLHKHTATSPPPSVLLLLSGHHIWSTIFINIDSAPRWQSFLAKRLREQWWLQMTFWWLLTAH